MCFAEQICEPSDAFIWLFYDTEHWIWWVFILIQQDCFQWVKNLKHQSSMPLGDLHTSFLFLANVKSEAAKWHKWAAKYFTSLFLYDKIVTVHCKIINRALFRQGVPNPWAAQVVGTRTCMRSSICSSGRHLCSCGKLHLHEQQARAPSACLYGVGCSSTSDHCLCRTIPYSSSPPHWFTKLERLETPGLEYLILVFWS